MTHREGETHESSRQHNGPELSRLSRPGEDQLCDNQSAHRLRRALFRHFGRRFRRHPRPARPRRQEQGRGILRHRQGGGRPALRDGKRRFLDQHGAVHGAHQDRQGRNRHDRRQRPRHNCQGNRQPQKRGSVLSQHQVQQQLRSRRQRLDHGPVCGRQRRQAHLQRHPRVRHQIQHKQQPVCRRRRQCDSDGQRRLRGHRSRPADEDDCRRCDERRPERHGLQGFLFGSRGHRHPEGRHDDQQHLRHALRCLGGHDVE